MDFKNIDAFAQIILRAIDDACTPIITRVKALEKETAELKTKQAAIGGVEYARTYQVGKTYAPGVLVTRNGGLWLSKTDTTAAPGSDPDSWRLVVKEGQGR